MDAGECWEWLGWRDKDGYGKYSPYKVGLRAHRYSYETFIGDIPDGYVIDHLCRNTSCVNPEHLEPVTNKENLYRGNGFSGVNYRKTHCISNHPLSGDNLRIQKKTGKRYCKECDRRRAREYARRKSAEKNAQAKQSIA